MTAPYRPKPMIEPRVPPTTTATATLQQPQVNPGTGMFPVKPAINPGIPGARPPQQIGDAVQPPRIASESGTMGTLGTLAGQAAGGGPTPLPGGLGTLAVQAAGQPNAPNLHPVSTGGGLNLGGDAIGAGSHPQVLPPPPAAGGLGLPGGGSVSPPVPGSGAQPGGQPSVPYAALSGFGPGNDLIGTQIAPTAGPDRAALAGQAYDLIAQQAEPAYQQQLRTVGQDAAKFGRIGSGLTTSQLGDVQALHQRDLNQAQQALSINAGGQTLADQAALRGELRGERGYQGGLQTQAQQDAINQQLVQDQLLNSATGREQGRIGDLIQLGQTGNPGSTLLGASGQVANQAGQTGQNASDLLQYWAMLQQLGKTAGAAAPAGGVAYGP
jgi:hypothetical protein